MLSDFWVTKYVSESGKSWNLFYRRNKDRFFRDRHWIGREFQELLDATHDDRLLEIGCGVGNFLFPLLALNDKVVCYGIDIAPEAISIIKESYNYPTYKDRLFVCVSDFSIPFSSLTHTLTQPSFGLHGSPTELFENPLETIMTQTNTIKPQPIDRWKEHFSIVTLIFMLSAIHPKNHRTVVGNIFLVLKKGGVILFRDYAVNDHTQLRFKESRKIDQLTFVRQDGTLSYFFSKDYLTELFTEVGLVQLENEYVIRKTTNPKIGLDVERIFLQARWLKK